VIAWLKEVNKMWNIYCNKILWMKNLCKLSIFCIIWCSNVVHSSLKWDVFLKVCHQHFWLHFAFICFNSLSELSKSFV
jgi:hypothetical protein